VKRISEVPDFSLVYWNSLDDLGIWRGGEQGTRVRYGSEGKSGVMGKCHDD